MPKILVSNLPVTTFINAAVDVDDGPAETLGARIAEAVKAGRWERARGEHAEDYEDLTLELNEQVVAYPLWSFETIGDVGGPPATPPSRGPGHTFFTLRPGEALTRAQFDEAWDGTEHLMRGGKVFTLRGEALGREEAWAELCRLHEFRDEGTEGPGGTNAHDHLLEVLGVDRA